MTLAKMDGTSSKGSTMASAASNVDTQQSNGGLEVTLVMDDGEIGDVIQRSNGRMLLQRKEQRLR